MLKDDTKRTFWKLAIVEELLAGSDGQVRAARVRVANSERRAQLLRRSIKHLYPLEVSATTKARDESTEQPERITECRRDAAVAGELRRRLGN